MVVENYRDHKEIPVIDLKSGRERGEVSREIMEACEEIGFFKVINHGVPVDVIDKMVDESCRFFAKPGPEKERAGPAKPYGYGCKTIGSNGDTGELEYILLQANPLSISHFSHTISDDPTKFRSIVNGYVEAVKGLACELLDLMGEGLWVPDTCVLSRLVRDVDSDSLFRINHYPPLDQQPPQNLFPHTTNTTNTNDDKVIGFGEHSDPQIITLLRSNDIPGLQICVNNHHQWEWVPILPDPTAFFVNVGDLLQVMTNGRFVSVRHRALVQTNKMRMSMAYFASPSLRAIINPLPNMKDHKRPPLYRPFTWAEYKTVTYSLRLRDSRLSLFKSNSSKLNSVPSSTAQLPPLVEDDGSKTDQLQN